MRETCMANDSYTQEKKEGYLIQASTPEANKIKMQNNMKCKNT